MYTGLGLKEEYHSSQNLHRKNFRELKQDLKLIVPKLHVIVHWITVQQNFGQYQINNLQNILRENFL